MTAIGWLQFGQFWTAFGGCPVRYPATYGSYSCVTAFVVPAVCVVFGAVVAFGVLAVLTVASVVVSSAVPGAVESVLAARHQRALQSGAQERRRGVRRGQEE